MKVSIFACCVVGLLAIIGYLLIGTFCLMHVEDRSPMRYSQRTFSPDELFGWIVLGWPFFYPLMMLFLWINRPKHKAPDE